MVFSAICQVSRLFQGKTKRCPRFCGQISRAEIQPARMRFLTVQKMAGVPPFLSQWQGRSPLAHKGDEGGQSRNRPAFVRERNLRSPRRSVSVAFCCSSEFVPCVSIFLRVCFPRRFGRFSPPKSPVFSPQNTSPSCGLRSAAAQDINRVASSKTTVGGGRPLRPAWENGPWRSGEREEGCCVLDLAYYRGVERRQPPSPSPKRSPWRGRIRPRGVTNRRNSHVHEKRFSCR